MKKLVFAVLFLIFLGGLANAEIIINAQPKKSYNLGDSFLIPVTIKSSSGATKIFSMDLICDGSSINFYKNGISLSAGEEKKLEASLILTKSFIGESRGTCVIKGIFGAEYALTQEFILSDKITLSLEAQELAFKPGETATIKGKAIKENGGGADGFIELKIGNENESGSITQLGTIQNGFFSVDIIIPEDMESKKYLLQLSVYEKEGEEKTNTGFLNSNVEIFQIPTSLEAIIETTPVEPGTNAKIRGVLHDQTGKNIDSTLTVFIKNNQTKLIEQIEKPTNEILEFPIKYNEKPLTWKVEIQSNGLTAETTFLIAEKKDINFSLVNNTLTVTNIGNVFYEDSLTIKIGEEDVFIDVALDVDESKEYKLNAPDGEYEISILKEGEEGKTYRSFLTGRAVSANEKRTTSGIIFSFAWIFVILILLIMAYILFRKSRKKTFFGHMPRFFKKKVQSDLNIPKTSILKKHSLLTSKNKAEVSLSITGNRQNSTVVCLNIKNMEEIEKTKGNAEETLQKIINFTEGRKALTYENQNNLHFILAPIKTRTFKNEVTALHIAQAIKKILTEHNRIFKQKVDFGISMNNGVIIAKPEKDSTKFTSMGNFISSAKKMAGTARQEIFFSTEVKDKLTSEIKAEKVKDQNNVYFIKEVRRYSEENKRFIDRFVKRLEK